MNTEPEEIKFYKAQPEELPKPTYWPLMLAVSITFFAWGLLTMWLITIMGIIGMGISLAGWINELRNAGKKE